MVFDQKAARYGWVDYLYLFRANWAMLVLSFALLMLVGVGIRWKTPKVYEATARIGLESQSESGSTGRKTTEMRARSLDQISHLEAAVLDRDLLLETVRACGLQARWDTKNRVEALSILKKRVTVSRDPNAEFFDISLKALTAEGAVVMVNSIAENFVVKRQREVIGVAKRSVADLRGEVAARLRAMEEIEARLYELSRNTAERSPNDTEVPDLRRQLVNENYMLRSLEAKQQLAAVELREATPGVSILALAGEEDVVSADSGRLALLLYGLAGVGLGCVLIGLTSRGGSGSAILKRIEEGLGIGLIGVAPVPSISLTSLNRPTGPIAEAYRDLRFRIHRLPAADTMVLNLLPFPGDHLTAEVAANLATVIADKGHPSIIIDTDFKGGKVNRLFDAAPSPGLSDFLLGEIRMEDAVVKTRGTNLWLMPSGTIPDDPSALLTSKRMSDLIWDLRSRFDYVITVSSTLGEGSDAASTLGYADHSILVAPYLGHSLGNLREAKEMVEAMGEEISGIVLSRRLSSRRLSKRRSSEARRVVKLSEGKA
ncbi:MAG: hypothetical protein AAGA96_08740 [Verrucomicrobiota bacterium]